MRIARTLFLFLALLSVACPAMAAPVRYTLPTPGVV